MMDILINSLVSKRAGKKLIDLFARDDNWHKLNRDEGDIGYGWLHYALIRIIKPLRVLCIGSRYGFIPAVCALACRDNGFGVVDFVDAGYAMEDHPDPMEHWGGVGWWKKCDPKKYFGQFGLERNIKLWVMKSEEYKKKNILRKYGYIYIDGDHSYRGVKLDFGMFWPQLNRSGFLAIHDIGSPDSGGNVYGTRKLWKEIRQNPKYHSFGFEENPGLGIIQK